VWVLPRNGIGEGLVRVSRSKRRRRAKQSDRINLAIELVISDGERVVYISIVERAAVAFWLPVSAPAILVSSGEVSTLSRKLERMPKSRSLYCQNSFLSV